VTPFEVEEEQDELFCFVAAFLMRGVI